MSVHEQLKATLADELEGAESEHAVDDLFDLLSDRYVRYVLYYLSERATTSLDQLAAVLAGLEAADRRAVMTPDDYEGIRIRLYHSVLPKLEEEGYVDFEPSARTVTRTHPSPIPPRGDAGR